MRVEPNSRMDMEALHLKSEEFEIPWVRIPLSPYITKQISKNTLNYFYFLFKI